MTTKRLLAAIERATGRPVSAPCLVMRVRRGLIPRPRCSAGRAWLWTAEEAAKAIVSFMEKRQ